MNYQIEHEFDPLREELYIRVYDSSDQLVKELYINASTLDGLPHFTYRVEKHKEHVTIYGDSGDHIFIFEIKLTGEGDRVLGAYLNHRVILPIKYLEYIEENFI